MQRITFPAFLLMPIAFGILAAICRFLVRSGVETRYQILVFWLLAGYFEKSRKDLSGQVRIARFIASALAVAAGAVTVRVCLEGIP